jgi:hypothetical protein
MIVCVQKYGLSQEQADAILALRLGRLTAAEESKLKKEHEELSEQVTFNSVTVLCNYCHCPLTTSRLSYSMHFDTYYDTRHYDCTTLVRCVVRLPVIYTLVCV